MPFTKVCWTQFSSFIPFQIERNTVSSKLKPTNDALPGIMVAPDGMKQPISFYMPILSFHVKVKKKIVNSM